jgi:hypothetical protein
MNNTRTVRLLIGVLSLGLGCGHFNQPGSPGVDIRGTITRVQRADEKGRKRGIIGSVLIEGVIEEDTKFDKGFITVTEKTRISEQRGPNRLRVKFEALEVGQRVESRFTGPVMQSHPVQAKALEIVILK